MRCVNSGCIDYTETRNNHCGRYADVTECDEMEPRNLAKPNAQPALSEVLAEIEGKAFWDYIPRRVVPVHEVEEILSKYFA